MVMSWFWTGSLGISILCALVTGKGIFLASSVLQGAQAGVNLGISMAGSLCLWSGMGKLAQASRLTDGLARVLRPVLLRLFPSAGRDPQLQRHLTGNICANLLGLGNAATPMGIQAARRLKQGNEATDELSRLIVLNTASIQLIPANVAAMRSTLGSSSPFDILLPVWISSLCSAGMGLGCAWILGKLRRR